MAVGKDKESARGLLRYLLLWQETACFRPEGTQVCRSAAGGLSWPASRHDRTPATPLQEQISNYERYLDGTAISKYKVVSIRSTPDGVANLPEIGKVA
jgi:hypothetical protein